MALVCQPWMLSYMYRVTNKGFMLMILHDLVLEMYCCCSRSRELHSYYLLRSLIFITYDSLEDSFNTDYSSNFVAYILFYKVVLKEPEAA